MAFAAPLQPDAGEAEVVGEDHGGEIDTPHLDRLAAGGLRFTQGYNTARCWPPRAALLTGYYAQAVRCYVLPGDRGWAKATRPLPWRSLTPEQREFQATKMAIHAALVEAMDREVGRIVRQLEAMHVLDDTLILFASDNGASAEIMIRGEGHDPTAAPGSRKTFLCLGPGWSTCSNAPFRRHKTWVQSRHTVRSKRRARSAL